MKAKILEIQKTLGLQDEPFNRVDIPWKIMKDFDERCLINRGEKQNDAPKVGHFISFFDEIAHLVSDLEFKCYVVGTKRPDSRLAIEGVKGKALDAVTAQTIHDFLKSADEFDFDAKTFKFRAWWD